MEDETQRRILMTNERLRAGVAGFGGEHGVDGPGRISEAGGFLGEMREYFRKPSSAGDLHHDFGQIEARQSSGDSCAKRDNRSREVIMARMGDF